METRVSSQHQGFARQYLEVSLEYYTRSKEIESSGRSLAQGVRDMDLKRVFWNTVWGGIPGSLVGNNGTEHTLYAALSAAAGAVLTVADEITHSGVKLEYAFWGTILGAMGGEWSYVGTEVGAVIGGGLGLLKTGADVVITRSRRKQRIKERLLRLDEEYVARREQLIREAERTLSSPDPRRNGGSAKPIAES